MNDYTQRFNEALAAICDCLGDARALRGRGRSFPGASVGYSGSLMHSQGASMRTVIAIALTLAANVVFASQVYKCKDANGTVVFSQRPCADDPAQVETVDTSRSLRTGTGGSVEEQSEFAAMNEIRRKCAARLDGISGRYAAQRASIARQIAALEASIERTNNNLAGATAESGLRQQIGSLSVERGSLAAAEASEMQSARQQCRDEEKAEEERQAEAQRARTK